METDPQDPLGLGTERLKIRLLLWDAPNIEWQIHKVIGRIPSRRERPNYKVLMEWLKNRTRKKEVLWSGIFVNQAEDAAAISKQQKWLDAMHGYGFNTFCKPRLEPGSDIDEEMVGWLTWFHQNHNLVEVMVASNDARRFYEPLMTIVRSGTPVAILGHSSATSRLRRDPHFKFVALESIPRVLDLSGLPTSEWVVRECEDHGIIPVDEADVTRCPQPSLVDEGPCNHELSERFTVVRKN